MTNLIKELSLKKATAYKVTVQLMLNRALVSRVEVHDNSQLLGSCDMYDSEGRSFIFYTKDKENIRITAPKANVESVIIEDLGCSLQEIDKYDNPDGVYIAMATIPSRESAMEEAVTSLVDQADKLLIYLNGYKNIPDFIWELHLQEKLDYILDPIGASAAAAKFFWAGQVQGYYFTCDDDIIYPTDYVEKTITRLKDYSYKSVVSYHGKNYSVISSDVRSDRTYLTKFEDAQLQDKRVHVLGTGVCAFHSKILNGYDAYHACLKLPRSMDLAFSMFLRKQNIKKITLMRKQGWIIANPKVSHGLNEQKQLNKSIKSRANEFLVKHNPIIDKKNLRRAMRPFSMAFSVFLFFIFKNKKIKKLFKQPKQFFVDMKVVQIKVKENEY